MGKPILRSFRFINLADLHASAKPEMKSRFLSSAEEITNCLKLHPGSIDFILISGDIWDRPQYCKEGYAVNMVVNTLATWSDYCPVFIVKGNNYHDAPGSIEFLHQIRPHIYAYERPVCLIMNRTDEFTPSRNLLIPDQFNYGNDADFILSLIPFPEKSAFVFPGSIDANNGDFEGKIKSMFELFSIVTNKYTCPKIMGLHANMLNSKMSEGQSLFGQEAFISPETIAIANHDYVGIGHIHFAQEFLPNQVMVGSFFNNNYGETEQKSFRLVEITVVDGKTQVTHTAIPFVNSRPLVNLEYKVENGEFTCLSSGQDISTAHNPKSQVKVKYTVFENERSLVTEAVLELFREAFGQDCEFAEDVIPVVRETRTGEEIMQVSALEDETTLYAKEISRDDVISDSLLNKIELVKGMVIV